MGFRYTCRDIARDLGVYGWVRNLPDGRVHMWAEGEAASVDELISRLESQFAVREKKVSVSGALRGFTDFNIEY